MPDGDCITDGRKSRISKRLLTILFNEHGVDIPSGMSVLHLCDNPPCGNWNHLMLGTQSDNTKQAYNKNRQRNCFESGEKHPNRKLSTFDVFEIIDMCKNGMPQYEVAKRFNINQSQVSRIFTGRRWKSVTGVQL